MLAIAIFSWIGYGIMLYVLLCLLWLPVKAFGGKIIDGANEVWMRAIMGKNIFTGK